MAAKGCAYRGRILNPVSPTQIEDIEDGLLVVDDGAILSCKPYKPDRAKDCEVVETGGVIIPGLVDVHSHIPQLDCRGNAGSSLLDWLERYIFPAEAAFSDPNRAEAMARRFFAEQLSCGTTTSALFTTVHPASTFRCFKVAEELGVRAIIGKMMMDCFSPAALQEETAVSLKESEALCAKWHGAAGGRLHYAFSPRFVPTCTREMLFEVGKLAAQSGAYIQSHIAETRGELTLMRELFPNNRDAFSIFEQAGCAGPKTILGHAIHLGDEEYKRMAKTKTKIAHCPGANLFLKSGALSLSHLEQAGVIYGFGSDVGAGTTCSLFELMRLSDYQQPFGVLSPTKAFYAATLGGAETLSLDDRIGNFDPKKRADFCLLKLERLDPSYRVADFETEELLALLMYRAGREIVDEVYVDGHRLNQ